MSSNEASTATIYDVADRAGVSISTVSLALNQPSRVAEATRDRVLTAVDELGFVPKATAVVRARQSLSRIGVLAPFTSYASFMERLSGALEVARSQDLELVLFDTDRTTANAHPLVSTLPITGRLDGVIVMSAPLSADAMTRLQRAEMPVVLLDSPQRDFSSIDIDDEDGGFQAGSCLINGGKRRLVFISEVRMPVDYETQADRRLAGLRRAARVAGLDDDAVEVVEVANSLDGGAEAMRQILTGSTPVGVFGHHDLLAAGALQEARAKGLSIPDEVAVVGFDDGDVAAALGLTTIRQPLRHAGRLAVTTLLESVADPTTPARRITLSVELIARSST